MSTTRSTQPILVPVDFSSKAADDLLFAARLAEYRQCPLLVLHVIHDRPDRPGFYHRPEFEPAYPIHDRAQDLMRRFIEDLKAASEDAPQALRWARSLLVEGLPALRIPEVAELEQAGLIVMSCGRGRGLFRKPLADQVRRRCAAPLMVLSTGDAAHWAELIPSDNAPQLDALSA